MFALILDNAKDREVFVACTSSLMRSGATALALGLVFSSFVVPARAATVFDNYTGNTSESFGASYVAGGFMPTGNFDFTGEAAFVQSREDTSQSFTLSLYSSASAGSPGSDELSVSATGSLVGVTYSGPAIALQKGATTLSFSATWEPSIGLSAVRCRSRSTPAAMG